MTIGRILTLFVVDVRFALTPGNAYSVSVRGRRATLTVLRETTVVECSDVGNAVTFDGSGKHWAYRMLRPLEFTDDADWLGEFTDIRSFTSAYGPPRTEVEPDDVVSREQAVAGMLKERHHISVFTRKDDLHPLSVRTRYASVVSVVYESESEEWESKPQGYIDEFFRDIYNEFIDVYRAKTTDVRPTYYHQSDRLIYALQTFVSYSANELAMEWSQRIKCPATPEDSSRAAASITFPIEPEDQFANVRPEAFPELARSVGEFLAQGRTVPESRKILSLAQRAVERYKNPNTAVIESAIAMEVALGTILRQYKIAKGVSNQKLNATKRDLGLSYQLNVELVMMLDPATDSERAIIRAADSVRTLRNGIIHDGESVSEVAGNKAVRDIRNLLDMLSGRGYFV